MLFQSQYDDYGKVTVSAGKILDSINEVQDVIFIDYSVEEKDENELCRATIRIAFSDVDSFVNDQMLDEPTQEKLCAYAWRIADDFINIITTVVQYRVEHAELVK